MRFIVLKDDLNITPIQRLDDYTSVIKQKNHFFECIRSFGTMIPLDEKLRYEELVSLFKKPDVIFIIANGGRTPLLWETIPKRTLRHSLGSLLFPEFIFNEISFPFNKVNLVLTDFQKQRLEKYLKKILPPMAIFAPKLDEKNFYPPTKKDRKQARKKLDVSDRQIHIVYAGRWLATKGICQLLRVLNLWPMTNTKVTLGGNFNPSFPLEQAGASHVMFENYFKRQFIRNNQSTEIKLIKPKNAQSLREVLWSADLFVYPSVHEDENFGMAPREALLCGVPVVVTDFCGLHPLTVQMPWGGITTYPTLHGSRYNLKQFRDLITQALKKYKGSPPAYSVAVKRECDPNVSRANLQGAIKLLLKAPFKTSLDMQNARKQMTYNLFRYADKKIIRAFVKKKSNPPDGAFVDGAGSLFSRNELFRAIQGMYTTMDEKPQVETGSLWRGFFPLGLWKEEKRLVEFGFPGPRIRYYSNREWKALISSSSGFMLLKRAAASL